ncbi:isoprenylcysteine carboxylmethyltransferase family protein [Acidobacteria bacterium AB60]|nr:isoprenylcysteine carboxylmethyltransferase family protein [Acidobacteria bacterium AB60]
MTAAPSSPPPNPDWITRWQRIARRIRVPLGFATAALYLFEMARRPPVPGAVAWSLLLVLPGLWLRAYSAGYIKKNQELTTTGPYAHVRNPLYLGSILIAAGFAVALMSWPVAVALAVMFIAIYVPVIASEERFLRATFPEFPEYCRRVPRLLPRLTPAPSPRPASPDDGGRFFLSLYLKHREYNALLGVALLYFSLVFLRAALNAVFRVPQ